jgi:hypothetical protein
VQLRGTADRPFPLWARALHLPAATILALLVLDTGWWFVIFRYYGTTLGSSGRL